jgi:uncharacterized coiled-coil DUF342 family protein
MKTHFKIAGLALLVALAVPGFAQDKPVVPYVDMSTAQALVDTLLKENETLKADAVKQRQDVAALTEQITLTKKWINDLVPILEEVKARNAEVATVSEPIVDRVLKAKAITAAEKNKAAEKKIAKRIDDLGAKIIELNKQIEPKLNQASVDDAKVGRNNDDIVLLQATISKTKVQEADLTAVIERVDALTTKVDSFVQQSLAAIK